METITIPKPDDFHVHLRDGEALHAVVPYTARQFGRALIMPNLTPPITTAPMAMAYAEKIQNIAHMTCPGTSFRPLMTIYLTDNTTPEDIVEVKQTTSCVIAAKLYPANATTNSAHGVTDIERLTPVFRTMERVGMVLCVHGETLTSKVFGDKKSGRVSQLHREAVFLQETMMWLVHTFPSLKIVLEHISTAEAVHFVVNTPANVAATITAHHLLATLDDVLESHHNKCMPILKEERHRQALLDAATSGNPKFFGGTDSAPHARSKKETACGCAGCFTAPHAVELYATAFEERGALHRLEGFLSHFGAGFYGLPRKPGTITLHRETWTIPDEYPFGDHETIVPFWAGKTLHWKVK